MTLHLLSSLTPQDGVQYGFIFVDIEEGDYVGNIIRKKVKMMKTKQKAGENDVILFHREYS